VIADLARLVGIESRYTDFYGAVHDLPEALLSTMLQAMGYPVASDADARACLRRLRESQGPLEPVYVIREARPTLECHLRGPVRWRLTCESGATRSGRAVDGRITLGEALEPGYHRLTVGSQATTVIAVPAAAFIPEALRRRRLWGLTAQLYAVRSRTDWGIGDFGHLGELLSIAADAGAATVAVNPLHQLSLTNPTSASPYAPTSRLYLNALYLDVPAAAARVHASDVLSRHADARALRGLRDATLIDYAGVAAVKVAALRLLYDAFRANPYLTPLQDAFSQFVRRGGQPLEDRAIYEALMHEFKRREPSIYGWMQWPAEYHDPRSPAVRAYAEANAREISFYQFLQWLADEQLAAAAAQARRMPIGLYRDLAVGVDANSADVWADRDVYALNVCIGAPPDPLNPAGQNWGLPPFDPLTLRSRAYGPYIALLRANMRHAGALRIDHVMGLMRLFCIPAGGTAADGTYISYRLDEMLGILALESHRNRCMIVGEDLGTVPCGFRACLRESGVFGCRLLYFEREGDGRFRAPEAYDEQTVASTGTHDVPPLAGFWAGTDLATRSRLGFFPDEAAAAAAASERALARTSLLRILEERGFLGKDEATELEHAQGSTPDDRLFRLVLAAYRLLGRSAARLLLVQLEDVLLQREQVNTPGTFDEVPNWRRRLSLSLEALGRDPRFLGLTRAVEEARSSPECP
jgi:(1->4)-alpha-D-glucan 1-alpha-D-glucosylmutase